MIAANELLVAHDKERMVETNISFEARTSKAINLRTVALQEPFFRDDITGADTSKNSDTK